MILVMVLGFGLLTPLTVKTYTNAPPIPERVVGADGETVFTRGDVEHGQEVFLKYAFMEHGTLWGHGAYARSRSPPSVNTAARSGRIVDRTDRWRVRFPREPT